MPRSTTPSTLPNGALVLITIDPPSSVLYLEDDAISRDAAQMGCTTCLAVVRHRCPKREYGPANTGQKYMFHLVGRSSTLVSGHVPISGPVPQKWKATEDGPERGRSSDHISLHFDMHNGAKSGQKEAEPRKDASGLEAAPKKKVNWFTGKADEPPDYRAQGLAASSIPWDDAYVDSLGMFVASISGCDGAPPQDLEQEIPRLIGAWEAWLDSFVAREASYVHTLYTAARKSYFTAEQELPMDWDAGDPHVSEFDRHAQLDYEPDFYAKYMSSANPEDSIIEMVYEHERFDRDTARLCVRVSGLTGDCQPGSPDDFLSAIRNLRRIILTHRPYVPPDGPPKEYSRFNWPKYQDTTAARPIPEPIAVPAMHKASGDLAGPSNAPAIAAPSTKSARGECIRKVRFEEGAAEPPPLVYAEKDVPRGGQPVQPSCTMTDVVDTVMSECCTL